MNTYTPIIPLPSTPVVQAPAPVRASTVQAFLTYVNDYNAGAREMDVETLESFIQGVRFIENPLDVLDLLKADARNQIRCEKIARDGDQWTYAWLLGIEGEDVHNLLFVPGDAVELICSQLVSDGDHPMALGGVEYFNLR